MMEKTGLLVTVDERNEKIGFKIREAQMEKIPYMVVLGDKEVEDKAVALRDRKGNNLGVMSPEALLAKLNKEIEDKVHD